MGYVNHIPSRALEAAGAWYTAATPTALRGNWREPNGTDAQLTVVVTYTRGGAGGYPKIRPVWTHTIDGGSTTRSGRDTTYDGSATASAPNLTVNNYLTVINLQSLTDANPDTVSVVIVAPPWATHLKIEAAEVGATGTPGTIVVDIDGEV